MLLQRSRNGALFTHPAGVGGARSSAHALKVFSFEHVQHNYIVKLRFDTDECGNLDIYALIHISMPLGSLMLTR